MASETVRTITSGGSTWSILNALSAAGQGAPRFGAVSCTAIARCGVVGTGQVGSAPEVTFAERHCGMGWSIRPAPNPAGATDSELQVVSCTSRTACFAVGSAVPSTGAQVTLAEAWDGSHWRFAPCGNPAVMEVRS
jgi:hypothetical protein